MKQLAAPPITPAVGPRRVASSRLVLGLLAALTLSLGLSLTGCGGPEIAEGDREPAPRFRLPALDGGMVALDDFVGQVVLLDFWATWCGPCHIQSDLLEPLYEEFRGRGVEFLSIDVAEPVDMVSRFLEANPVPNPVLLDEDGEVNGLFEVQGLPTLVLIDKEGKIAFYRTGITGRGQVRQLIEAEL